MVFTLYHFHEATKQQAGISPDPLQRYLARLISDCNQLDSLAALSFDLEDTTQITLDQVYIDLNTTDSVPLCSILRSTTFCSFLFKNAL